MTIGSRPAFPCPSTAVDADNLSNHEQGDVGMSLREYIATHALAGMLASEVANDYSDNVHPRGAGAHTIWRLAVDHADKLIEALGND